MDADLLRRPTEDTYDHFGRMMANVARVVAREQGFDAARAGMGEAQMTLAAFLLGKGFVE